MGRWMYTWDTPRMVFLLSTSTHIVVSRPWYPWPKRDEIHPTQLAMHMAQSEHPERFFSRKELSGHQHHHLDTLLMRIRSCTQGVKLGANNNRSIPRLRLSTTNPGRIHGITVHTLVPSSHPISPHTHILPETEEHEHEHDKVRRLIKTKSSISAFFVFFWIALKAHSTLSLLTIHFGTLNGFLTLHLFFFVSHQIDLPAPALLVPATASKPCTSSLCVDHLSLFEMVYP